MTNRLQSRSRFNLDFTRNCLNGIYPIFTKHSLYIEKSVYSRTNNNNNTNVVKKKVIRMRYTERFEINTIYR